MAASGCGDRTEALQFVCALNRSTQAAIDLTDAGYLPIHGRAPGGCSRRRCAGRDRALHETTSNKAGKTQVRYTGVASTRKLVCGKQKVAKELMCFL